MQQGSKAAMSSGERVAENVIGAGHQVAALVPCYNEEHAVAKVAADFPAALLALAIAAIGLAIPIFITYIQEGLVPRLPTAVLSSGLMLLAFLSIAVGLILDTVTRGCRGLKLLAYLALRAPGGEWRRT
jgi:hypothetical protein